MRFFNAFQFSVACCIWRGLLNQATSYIARIMWCAGFAWLLGIANGVLMLCEGLKKACIKVAFTGGLMTDRLGDIAMLITVLMAMVDAKTVWAYVYVNILRQ